MASRNLGNGEVKLEKVCQMCRKQRRGAAAVEFAIVAPVFFLLVFGMIEYGRMVMVQQVLPMLQEKEPESAVLDPPTGQMSLPLVTTKVNNYLTAADITGSDNNYQRRRNLVRPLMVNRSQSTVRCLSAK